jgi:hypothetical protein
VALVDGNQNPMANAPVNFTVTQGGGFVIDPISNTSGNELTIHTDSDGKARVQFLTAGNAGSISSITASAGKGPSAISATVFTEFASAESGYAPTPASSSGSDSDGTSGSSSGDLRNVSVLINADGSLDISWTNTNQKRTAPIPIKIQLPDGSWTTVATVPPATSTAHIPPQ